MEGWLEQGAVLIVTCVTNVCMLQMPHHSMFGDRYVHGAALEIDIELTRSEPEKKTRIKMTKIEYFLNDGG